MTRVKQTKMRLELNPLMLSQETVVYINYDNTVDKYDTSRKRFFVLLPQVVADALGIKEVRGSDQAEAEKLFAETIKKFKTLHTEVNRVILYNFQLCPDLGRDKHYYSPNGYSVNIWAGTYQETVAIAGDGNRRYSYEKVESPIEFPGAEYRGPTRYNGEKFENQVPWTDTNEKFFVWVKDRMGELINGLVEISKPAQLIETINAGRLLPIGKRED